LILEGPLPGGYQGLPISRGRGASPDAGRSLGGAGVEPCLAVPWAQRVGVGWKKTVLIVLDDSIISYTIHTYLHPYMHTYIHTYLPTYVRTYIYIYYIYMYIHLFIHLFIYLYMYLFVYLFIYRIVHIYIYIYLVSCLFTYVYIYTRYS